MFSDHVSYLLTPSSAEACGVSLALWLFKASLVRTTLLPADENTDRQVAIVTLSRIFFLVDSFQNRNQLIIA